MAALAYPAASLWSLRRRRADPLGFLESLAAAGDVVPFRLGRQMAVLLNRPEDVEGVLVTHAANFAKGPANDRAKRLLGTGLLTADPPLHTARRRAVQPAFGRQMLDDYAGTVVARASRMVDEWRAGASVDLGSAFARLTFEIIGETVIGADVSAHFDAVRDAVAVATASVDALLSSIAPLGHLRDAQARLRGVADRIVDDARAPRPGSLLALLGEADTPEARAQRRDDVLTILLAGHDTITNALTFTLPLVAAHPEVEARLRAEVAALGDRPAAADLPALAYTRRVLAEALRLYPPAWVLARRALADHAVDGGVVPAGALVLVSQYLMHRDGRYYDRPLAFDPDRWLPERQASRPRMAYFPFGAGARACIGEGFAWMEGVLILATVASRWRLRPADAMLPALDPRITLRPKGAVRMRVEAW